MSSPMPKLDILRGERRWVVNPVTIYILAGKTDGRARLSATGGPHKTSYAQLRGSLTDDIPLGLSRTWWVVQNYS